MLYDLVDDGKKSSSMTPRPNNYWETMENRKLGFIFFDDTNTKTVILVKKHNNTISRSKWYR